MESWLSAWSPHRGSRWEQAEVHVADAVSVVETMEEYR